MAVLPGKLPLLPVPSATYAELDKHGYQTVTFRHVCQVLTSELEGGVRYVDQSVMSKVKPKGKFPAVDGTRRKQPCTRALFLIALNPNRVTRKPSGKPQQGAGGRGLP